MQAIRQTEGFQHLDEVAQKLVDRLEQDQKRLRRDLETHTERISHNQNQTNDIITREHEQTRRTILASLRSGRSYKPSETQDVFSGGSVNLAQQEKDSRIESLLVASLRFSTMENRFEEIESAHRKTFEWIFQPPAQESKWSNFPQWLLEGFGIYWINGKAASGKSTLMRFICENPRTDTLLNEWSSPDLLIRATHFFWNSGTPDQRSYQGLLRALLYDILRQARPLIRVVFSNKWAAHQGHPTEIVPSLDWTLPSLIKAFDLLFQETAGTELRFCLFVDGLDEYDGDPFDIIDLFMRISQSPNVKLCLSSRPLYDFVKSFKAFPTLRLQDLNFNDIKQYVDDELGANHQMQELQRKEPGQAPKLSQEIIDKADGVFLWVRLVVLSLLRGLRNSDQVSDLQRRLRILPPSLEDLFSHMLGRLEPVYMEQSSRIFQIFAASRLEGYTLMPLSSLELSFAEEADAQRLLSSPAIPLTDQEWIARIESVDIWLVTRCGGLIEASIPTNSDDINRNLSYLHRTVRDFLELPQVWSRIIGPTRGSDFNPHVSLLQSSVLYIRLALKSKINPLGALDFAAMGLRHAYQAELETNRPQILLLDKLDKMIKAEPGLAKFEVSKEGYPAQYNEFLAVVVRNGLYHFLAHKIECQPDVISKNPGRPLLQHAVNSSLSPFIGEFQLSSNIVDLLMQNGADPNQIYGDQSAWGCILSTFADHLFDDAADKFSSELLKIVQIFIENGAHVNKEIYQKITKALEAVFPEEAKRLQDLMVAKGALKEENRSQWIEWTVRPIGPKRNRWSKFKSHVRFGGSKAVEEIEPHTTPNLTKTYGLLPT
jgi:hypothetical protein